MTELIRLSLLIGDKVLIKKYFKIFSNLPESVRKMDEEVYLRFILSFPEQFNRNLKIQILPKRYKWLEKFKIKKQDKIYQTKVKNCRVKIKNFTRYVITGFCPSCSEEHTLLIRGTIVINKNYFCPCCFAKQKLTFNELSQVIRRDYPFLLKENPEEYIERYDFQIHQTAKNLNQSFSNNPIPKLMRYLNQDIVAVMNQLVLSNLISEE